SSTPLQDSATKTSAVRAASTDCSSACEDTNTADPVPPAAAIAFMSCAVGQFGVPGGQAAKPTTCTGTSKPVTGTPSGLVNERFCRLAAAVGAFAPGSHVSAPSRTRTTLYL